MACVPSVADKYHFGHCILGRLKEWFSFPNQTACLPQHWLSIKNPCSNWDAILLGITSGDLGPKLKYGRVKLHCSHRHQATPPDKQINCTFFFLSLKGIPLFLLFIYLFIHSWLRGVFASVQGPPLAAASGGHSSPRCAGLPPSRPLLLRSTSSRCAGSAVVAHGPSCSLACGIFPDQGSNPCPLH